MSHEWKITFTFSIYGEDEEGRPLRSIGNGTGVGTPRTLTMKRPVIVPSVRILSLRVHWKRSDDSVSSLPRS